jgi:plasmid stabilization system protein ParE
MARIELAPETADDFERIFEHIAAVDPEGGRERIATIILALDVLAASPQIGRPAAAANLRELIIGQGIRGYVALYRYERELDTVFVLAIRSQREAGYRRT